MKRLVLTIAMVIATLGGAMAQSKTSVAYHNAALYVKGSNGFKLKVANTYTLDGAGFVPTFDTKQATLEGTPFSISPSVRFSNLQTELSGSFSKHWGFQFHFNYAGNKISLLNMLLDYQLSDNLKLTFGQMKVPGPASKNYSTSSAMAMDTPMGLSMASSRRFGLALYSTSGRHYAALGAYTFNLNDFVGIGLPKRPEVGVAGRFAYNVVNKRLEKLQLGANAYWMRMANGNSVRTGAMGIETGAIAPKFVTYNYANTKSQLNYGVELAYQNKNFLFTAEGLGTNFFRAENLPTPQYAGWNVRASYTVLGNPRSYKASSGDFSGSPYDGDQALELGVRASGLYLNDHEGTEALAGMSYGAFANYWTTKHLCFSLHANYLDHHKDFHGSYSVAGDNFKGIDFVVVQGRITIVF